MAADLAIETGEMLGAMKDRLLAAGTPPHEIRRLGDRTAHDHLMSRLAEERPDDIVLSEEGSDDRRRLEAERVWIIDPLDGTRDYASSWSDEWAVHVALVEERAVTAAAVAATAAGLIGVSGEGAMTSAALVDREPAGPVVVTARSTGGLGRLVAAAIDARLVACGSAGLKAMLVVAGEVDVYAHGSQLYEWDVAAPAGVAEAAGLVVTDLRGDALSLNRSYPIVDGLVVSRPEFAEDVARSLARRW